MLAAQVGHGELADAFAVAGVAAGGEAAVIGLHGFAGQKVVGNVLDVVAVVGGFGPVGIAGLDALRAQLHGSGEGVDLHARVVVIELARDLPALRGQQVADGVAQRGLPPVAHVQRAGGVGADEFHQHAVPALRLPAVVFLQRQHFAHGLLLGGGLEADVDEAGAGDFGASNAGVLG